MASKLFFTLSRLQPINDHVKAAWVAGYGKYCVLSRGLATARSLYHRAAILAARTKSELAPFWRRQNPVNIGGFVALVYRTARAEGRRRGKASSLSWETPAAPWPIPRGAAYPSWGAESAPVLGVGAAERGLIRAEEQEVRGAESGARSPPAERAGAADFARGRLRELGVRKAARLRRD